MSDHFSSLADTVNVFIVTNAKLDNGEIEALDNILKDKGFEYEYFIPQGLGHPYLLTWSHFDVFRRLISNESVTHFMYLEDDLLVTRANIDYWNESLEVLAPHGLIPSFLRIEQNHHNLDWYSSDAREQFYFPKLPKIYKNINYAFINLPHPYQGMYLLTKELMHEHFNSKSSNPDYGIWSIREKAAQGLTFEKIPEGFTSRNLLGFDLKNQKFDSRCFIHHLPDNYANRNPPDGGLGTIQIDKVILVRRKDYLTQKFLRSLNKRLGLK